MLPSENVCCDLVPLRFLCLLCVEESDEEEYNNEGWLILVDVSRLDDDGDCDTADTLGSPTYTRT